MMTTKDRRRQAASPGNRTSTCYASSLCFYQMMMAIEQQGAAHVDGPALMGMEQQGASHVDGPGRMRMEQQGAAHVNGMEDDIASLVNKMYIDIAPATGSDSGHASGFEDSASLH